MAQKKLQKQKKQAPTTKPFSEWKNTTQKELVPIQSKFYKIVFIIVVIIVHIMIIPITVRFHNIRVAGLENIRGAVCWKTKELLCVGADQDQDQPTSQPARQD